LLCSSFAALSNFKLKFYRMKTLISYAVSILFIVTLASFASTTVSKPVNSCFKTFRIHRQANDVALTWSVSTSDVSSFTVERSYDGDMFDPILQAPCNGTATHKYRDAAVYPGFIHYRIAASKADGTVEYSAVETVRIVRRH